MKNESFFLQLPILILLLILDCLIIVSGETFSFTFLTGKNLATEKKVVNN